MFIAWNSPQSSRHFALKALEFLRRFVPHVLPRGFVKMRHYGLLANRFREAVQDSVKIAREFTCVAKRIEDNPMSSLRPNC